jgi:hypothetical protein
MTNEPTLLSVAPLSVDSEVLPPMDKYRGIVEDAVFDRLGRPSFFADAVEMVMGRIAARIEGGRATAGGTARGNSLKSCCGPL